MADEEEQQRIKFEKIIALLLKKLNDPFTQCEQIVDRISFMFGIVHRDAKKPDLTVAVMLERLGRITKKLQRIEGYAGKEKGKERDNRRTINLKDKDQISRDGARTETVLQVFLEKSDALLTKMEEYTYNINAGLTRLDVDIPPANTIRNMSQKRVMQLVISRISQLNGTLSRIENVLVDAFLELASRADPEKSGLVAEDAQLRAKSAPANAIAINLHDARQAILERAGEQPQLMEAVRKAARSSAEWAATKSGKAAAEIAESAGEGQTQRRSGKRQSIRNGPAVPPRPANLKLDPSRRSGKNLNLSADNLGAVNRGAVSARSARRTNNPDAISPPSPKRSPHSRPSHTARKDKERDGHHHSRPASSYHPHHHHDSPQHHHHSKDSPRNNHNAPALPASAAAAPLVPKEDSAPAISASAAASAPVSSPAPVQPNTAVVDKAEAAPAAAANGSGVAAKDVNPDKPPAKDSGCCIVQ